MSSQQLLRVAYFTVALLTVILAAAVDLASHGFGQLSFMLASHDLVVMLAALLIVYCEKTLNHHRRP